MTDPGMPVLQSVSSTGHGSHDTIDATASGVVGAVDSGAAGATASGTPGTVDSGAADAAVRSFYKENAPLVLSYATGLLGDRYLAEDVVQETMLRAWRHYGRFSTEKGSVRGWLMRVAHNIAMDKLRMRRSRPIEVAEISGPEPQVGDHADAVVTALHIRQVLARLSPAHRNVLEQVYLNGLTAAEAAVVLGIPEGTVFSRAYYGLRMLRRELGMPPGGPQRKERRAGPVGTLAA
jgi:RNA polymerase sigma-70 factor, ECF subfamily